MPICAAFNCNFKPDRMKIPGRSYHRFPFSRPEILKMWIIKVRRKNWTPNRFSILCSSHFEEDCFYSYGRNVYLKQDAVPTIFDYPMLSKKIAEKRKPSPERICENYLPHEVIIPNDPEVDAKNVKKEHSYTINPLKLKHTSDKEKSWTKQRVKAKSRQDNSYQKRTRENPPITKEMTNIREYWSNQECETRQRKKAKLRQDNTYQGTIKDDASITDEQTDIIRRILNSINKESATSNPEILESDFSALEDSLTFHSSEQCEEASDSNLCQTPSPRRKRQKRRSDHSPDNTSFIKELIEEQNQLISQQVLALNTIADLNRRLISALTNSQL